MILVNKMVCVFTMYNIVRLESVPKDPIPETTLRLSGNTNLGQVDQKVSTEFDDTVPEYETVPEYLE